MWVELKVGAIKIWGCSPAVFLAKLLQFFLSPAVLWGQHGTAVRITQPMLHLGRGSGNSVCPSVSWGQQPPYPGHEPTINVLCSVWGLFKLLFSFFFFLIWTAPCFIVHISVLQLSALISQKTQFIQVNDTKNKQKYVKNQMLELRFRMGSL